MISRTSGQEQPTDTSKTSPEYRKKLLRKAAALGLAGTALFGVAACSNGSGENKANAAPATISAEATPAAVAATPEASPTTEAPVDADITANIELNNKVSVEVFNGRSDQERWSWAWSKCVDQVMTAALSEFMDQPTLDGTPVYLSNPAAYMDPANDLDLATKASPPNELDDGVRIMKNQIFMEQLASAWKTNLHETGNGPRDLATATKLISGMSLKVGELDKSGQYNETLSFLKGSTEATKTVDRFDKYRVYATSDLQKGVDEKGNPTQIKGVIYSAGIGKTYEAWYQLAKFKDTSGQEQSMWLKYSETIAKRVSF